MDKIHLVTWNFATNRKINGIVSTWVHLLSVLISKDAKKQSHLIIQSWFSTTVPERWEILHKNRSTEPPYRCPTLRCSWPAIWLDQLHTYRCCTLAKGIRLTGVQTAGINRDKFHRGFAQLDVSNSWILTSCFSPLNELLKFWWETMNSHFLWQIGRPYHVSKCIPYIIYELYGDPNVWQRFSSRSLQVAQNWVPFHLRLSRWAKSSRFWTHLWTWAAGRRSVCVFLENLQTQQHKWERSRESSRGKRSVKFASGSWNGLLSKHNAIEKCEQQVGWIQQKQQVLHSWSRAGQKARHILRALRRQAQRVPGNQVALHPNAAVLPHKLGNANTETKCLRFYIERLLKQLKGMLR